MENHINKDFWDHRWETKATGWDIGYASPAITNYMKEFCHKDAAILIPGCGNAYEAEYLLENGFTNISLIDIAPKAVENLKLKFQNNNCVTIFCADFFEHKEKYDLIIEQTFFCAIHPSLRSKYAHKVFELLKPNGRLMGVLFNTYFGNETPPFGGNTEEYRGYFQSLFEIKKMEICYNSILPREGKEVFIEFIKKDEKDFY